MISGSKRPSYRTDRMADLIREEVARFLINGIKDPRVGFVTVTRVTITPDLQVARVYYSAFGSDAEKKETELGLEESVGKVRSHLARTLKARYTPRVEFYRDEGLEHSYHINELLSKL